MSGSWKLAAIPALAAGLLRTVGRTARIEVEDPFGTEDRADAEPVIWLVWHNRAPGLAIVRFRLYPHRRATILSSISRDGEYMARTMGKLGMAVVRGSSTRKGREALRGLVQAISSGSDVALTPDGPRGPLYVVKPGALKLAQLTGAPVRLVHIAYSRALRLRSWDRYQIPLPFCKLRAVFSPPVYLERKMDEEAFEELRSTLETRMREPLNDTDAHGDH